jgi:hypothetical protein
MAIKFTITGTLDFDYHKIDEDKIYLDANKKLVIVPAFKSSDDFIEFFDDELKYEVKIEEFEKPYSGEGWDY